MSAVFDPLHEELLRGGVGRRHARRYVAELRDHLDDLVAEEIAAGHAPGEARDRAMARLGDMEALAQAMTARSEFRAWTARAPAAAYVLAPPLALCLGIALSMCAIVLMVNMLRPEHSGAASLPAWTPPLVDGVVGVVNAALAVLIGWGLALGAVRNRASAFWPLLGFVVLAAAGAALQVDVTLPLAGRPGEVELHSGFDGPLFAAGGFAARFVADLLAIFVAYAGLNVWRSERAQRGWAS